MRRVIAITLLLSTLTLLFAGCTGEPALTTEPTKNYLQMSQTATLETSSAPADEESAPTKEPEEWENVKGETNPPEAEEESGGQTTANGYYAPWNNNVVSGAKSDGKLHYYFMSSEGKPMITTAIYPEKWGDCCLIVMPDGTTLLMDAGHKPFAEILVKNLHQMGVTQIDYLLISHFHTDHFGGALESGGLLDRFPVGQVYVTNAKDTNGGSFEKKCKTLNIPVKTLMEGDDFQLGQMRLRVLWPTKTQETPQSGNSEQINNTSLVVRLDYQEHSALFTGDIYSGVEQTLVSKYPALLDVDLLKAPHHGDSTSNSLSFVAATSPKLVVATGFAGLQNVTQMIYEGVGAQLLNDKSWGYIHVDVDGASMKWETSR